MNSRRLDPEPLRLHRTVGLRDRFAAWWNRSGQTDYFELLLGPFRRWKQRHVWPLAVYGLTLGVLCSGRGLPSPREALRAIPLSLAVDVAIVCIWWLAVRVDALSGGRFSSTLRILRQRPATWRWRHEWFFIIWLVLALLCVLAIPLWSLPAEPGDEFSWGRGIIVSVCGALFGAPIAALPVCFFGWLLQMLCYLLVARRSLQLASRSTRRHY